MLHTCTSLTLLVLSWIEGMFWEEIIEQKSSLLRPTCSPTPSSTAHLGFVSQHTVHATKTLTIVPFLFRIHRLLLQVCRLQCSLLSKTCPRLERQSEGASKQGTKPLSGFPPPAYSAPCYATPVHCSAAAACEVYNGETSNSVRGAGRRSTSTEQR